MDEELQNLKDEILSEFSGDIQEINISIGAFEIYFKRYQGFRKKHLKIIEMTKEVFDWDKVWFQISLSAYIDPDESEEVCLIKLSIEDF